MWKRSQVGGSEVNGGYYKELEDSLGSGLFRGFPLFLGPVFPFHLCSQGMHLKQENWNPLGMKYLLAFLDLCHVHKSRIKAPFAKNPKP